ncbi:SCO family protein [Psychroserpens luteus]|uniref:SCO family protein n=1 Tax=Psychroserpens luteus TaxID=1434066 RepID=A0ABW5ZT73_9FLAO|nr:SCO family protein [Psychroserpens luteus]
MKLYKTNIILSCLLFIAFVGCKDAKTIEKTSRVDTLPYYAEATFTPKWLDGENENLESFHKIPSFNLTNQLGETVTEKTFEDKIYIADFFFTTCPGICPKMTANMKVLQDAFLDDNDILLLSHSVTPEIDSVSTLKKYAESKGVINSKWHLVTGDRKQIYDLGRQSYFAEEDLGLDKTDEDFLHTENFVLIDQNRHIRGIYNGLNKTAVQQLIADVKTLQRKID